MSQEIRQIQQTSNLPKNNELINALRTNQIFIKLPFSNKLIQEISSDLQIVKVHSRNRIHLEEFEILLVVQGVVYQYVPNVWGESQKNWELNILNSDVLLFRKICKNGFYTSYHPKYAHNQSQIIADVGSKIIKIPQNSFIKYFQKKLQYRFGSLTQTLKNFQFTRWFKNDLLYELAKHLNEISLLQGSIIYQKGTPSDYLYFVKNGTVELYEKKLRLDKKKQNFTNIFGKGKVVGLDGIITPSEGNRRQFNCQALTNVQLLHIDRRILIILVCSAKQKDSFKSYREINLGEQFDHISRKSQVIFNKNKLKQTLTNSFKFNYKLGKDIFKIHQNPRIDFLNNPQQYSSRSQTKCNHTYSSQFLPQSRISVIKMGHEDQQDDQVQEQSQKSLMRRRSLSFLKFSSSTSRFRREYRQEMQQLVQIKRLQQQNAKVKLVSKSKLDQKMKSTIKIKRIFASSKSQNSPRKIDPQDILYRKLQSLNQNPLLLNFQSKRKRMLQQIKKNLVQ